MTALAGTPALVRLALRRDRFWLPGWVIGIGAFEALMAGSVISVYPDAKARAGAALTIDNPGSTFLLGRRYGAADYPWGHMVGHQTLLWCAVLFALLAGLTMTRHTRAEEEAGRTELLRAGRVGRLAPLLSAVAMTGLVVLLSGLATTVVLVGLRAQSVTATGAAIFGLAQISVGACFAGLATVTTQLARTSRGANGLLGGLLGACFTLRGIGDVAGTSLGAATPLGWAQRMHPWAENAWGWALPGVLAGVALFAVGAWLSQRRDLGGSLLPQPAGRPRAARGLVSPLGLALRLARTPALVWTAAMFGFGIAYGPVLSQAEKFLRQMPALQDFVPGVTDGVRLFAAIIVGMAALLCTVPGVQVVTRMVADERAGRSAILHTATPRATWYLVNVLTAVLSAALPVTAFGAAFGFAGARVRDDADLGLDILVACLAHLPAMAVVIGAAALVAGWSPRLTGLAWAVLAHAVAVHWFAGPLKWPTWAQWPSAFDHVGARPALAASSTALVVLTGVAAAAVAVGLFGYRRRALG